MVDERFHPFVGAISLAKLLEKIGHSELISTDIREQQYIVHGASELTSAKRNEIGLAANKKYKDALKSTNAGAVIVHNLIAEFVPHSCLSIITSNPQLIFAKMVNFLYPQGILALKLKKKNRQKEPLIEEGAIINSSAIIGNNVEIGRQTIIGANVTIGDGVTIGRNCYIESNSSIECSHIGDNVIIHSGARIGSEGFGWLELGKSNIKVPQLGRVIIQDGVEIGANCCIDRGTLGDTSIGEGTKIDNLVQIGHNCKIGRYCLIAATSGLSGSTIIEDGCMLGGGVGTSGHLTIGANSIVHGRAAVTKDWPAESKIIGAPAQEIKNFWKELAAIRRLYKGEKRMKGEKGTKNGPE